MGKAEFDKPHYQDEAKAREYIERHRWPDGPVCPHCGVVNHAYKINIVEEEATKVDPTTIFGILPEFTGGLSVDEYLKKQRGEEPDA